MYYIDADGDGYGSASTVQYDCYQPSNFVDNNDDCDDSEPLAWTGNTEACDGVDNNCNGSTDEGALITYYFDDDLDGYGD